MEEKNLALINQIQEGEEALEEIKAQHDRSINKQNSELHKYQKNIDQLLSKIKASKSVNKRVKGIVGDKKEDKSGQEVTFKESGGNFE